MPEPFSSAPEDREAVSRTLNATSDAMSFVRQSMRALRSERGRTEKRVQEITGDITAAKKKLANAIFREQEARKALEGLRRERDNVSSDLLKEKKENAKLRMRIEEAEKRCEELTDRLNRKVATVDENLLRETQQLQRNLDHADQRNKNIEIQLMAQREFREATQLDLEAARRTANDLKKLLSEILQSGQRTLNEISGALIVEEMEDGEDEE